MAVGFKNTFLEGSYQDDVRGSVAVDQVAIMSGMTAERPGYKGSLEAGHLPNYSLEMEGGSYKLVVAGKARDPETYTSPVTEAMIIYSFGTNNNLGKEAAEERRRGHPRRHTAAPQSHEAESHSFEAGHGQSLEKKVELENGKPETETLEWGDPRALVMHIDC